MKSKGLLNLSKKALAVILAGMLSSVMFIGCGNDVTTTSSTGQDNGQNAGNHDEADQNESGNGTGSQNGEGTNEVNDEATNAGSTESLLSGKHHVEIVIKELGTIYVELDADAAPITVTNFVKLAEEGFYDGVVFHRIMEGFMMQGGDPSGTGMGGSKDTIVGEFASNGIENPLSHTRGAISMARATNPDSASSQFFIVHEDSTFLDGDYAAFGYVTEGMDIVDTICETTTGQDANGIVPEENRPIIETIRVVD